ncbi:MAG: hypothetical protein BWY07_01671 [Candidatus Hydrogenedentes bacterium ADurb.Bin170]|nr:MAG: hypothetical protein BWY07_01671 [Candidatus Hydrogenedentes bacterium ADurb.Bin170]
MRQCLLKKLSLYLSFCEKRGILSFWVRIKSGRFGLVLPWVANVRLKGYPTEGVFL